MYKQILVPIDVSDVTLAGKAITAATELARASGGAIRLLNVMALTPVMLAEYVPPDFEGQQHTVAEEALAKVVADIDLGADRVTGAVRQGGIYHEILEEANEVDADLIVMTSHRPAMRSYFLGSNAGHVVRYAKCSVLVVRSGDQEPGKRSAGGTSAE